MNCRSIALFFIIQNSGYRLLSSTADRPRDDDKEEEDDDDKEEEDDDDDEDEDEDEDHDTSQPQNILNNNGHGQQQDWRFYEDLTHEAEEQDVAFVFESAAAGAEMNRDHDDEGHEFTTTQPQTQTLEHDPISEEAFERIDPQSFETIASAARIRADGIRISPVPPAAISAEDFHLSQGRWWYYLSLLFYFFGVYTIVHCRENGRN